MGEGSENKQAGEKNKETLRRTNTSRANWGEVGGGAKWNMTWILVGEFSLKKWIEKQSKPEALLLQHDGSEN